MFHSPTSSQRDSAEDLQSDQESSRQSPLNSQAGSSQNRRGQPHPVSATSYSSHVAGGAWKNHSSGSGDGHSSGSGYDDHTRSAISPSSHQGTLTQSSADSPTGTPLKNTVEYPGSAASDSSHMEGEDMTSYSSGSDYDKQSNLGRPNPEESSDSESEVMYPYYIKTVLQLQYSCFQYMYMSDVQ